MRELLAIPSSAPWVNPTLSRLPVGPQKSSTVYFGYCNPSILAVFSRVRPDRILEIEGDGFRGAALLQQ